MKAGGNENEKDRDTDIIPLQELCFSSVISMSTEKQ